MNINDIADRAYDHANKAGFIGDRTSVEKLKDLQSEYTEALKALNEGNITRWDLFDGWMGNGEDFKYSFEACIKDSYEDELTDMLFVTLTLMNDCGMDKEKHINAKMKYNELREDHR